MGKIVKNYLYNISYQILIVILPLVTIPFLSRVLGVTNTAVNSYVESVVALFTSFGMLGLNLYSNREIAYRRKNKDELTSAFYELLLMRLILLAFVTIIYILFGSHSEYHVYFQIQYITLLANFFDVAWLFTGLEDMKTVIIRNFIIKIITTIFIFICIRRPSDLSTYMWINGIGGIASSFSMYPLIFKYINKKVIFKRINIVQHILPTLALFLPQAASQLYLQFDKVMIEALSDLNQLAYYTQSERVVKMPLIITTALTAVLMPRIAKEFSEGNMSSISKYLGNALNGVIIIIVPIIIGIIGIAQDFVPWFFGNDYIPMTNVLRLISVIIFPIALSSVTGSQYLTPTNQTKILTVSYCSAALTNIVINAFLIPVWGAYGAAVGTIIAEYMVLAIQYFFVKKQLGSFHIFHRIVKSLISSLIMGFVVFIIGIYLPSLIWTTLIQIVVGCFVYIIFMILFKDENCLYILNLLRSKLSWRKSQ